VHSVIANRLDRGGAEIAAWIQVSSVISLVAGGPGRRRDKDGESTEHTDESRSLDEATIKAIQRPWRRIRHRVGDPVTWRTGCATCIVALRLNRVGPWAE